MSGLAPESTFVGRGADLRAVREALDAGEATVLTGPAGIGKSALARVALIGRPTAAGTALSSLWTVPYLPLAHAVGSRLVGDPEAVADEVLNHLAGRILLLEDLHWADQGTIDALGLLIGRLPLLMTVRTRAECGHGHADSLVAASRTLVRLIDLAPLPRRTARALAARRHATLSANEIDQLVEVAGGNPLLLEELPVLGAVTPSLRAALAARLDALTPIVRHELLVLAVAVAPVSAAALAPLVEDANAAAVLEERAGFLEFRHASLAEAVVAQSSAGELTAAHERAAVLVEEVAARCHHLLQARRPGEAERTATVALTSEANPISRARLLAVLASTRRDSATAIVAARALLDVGDWTEAVGHAHCIDPLDRQEWAEGRLIAGVALWAAGRPSEAARTLDEGIAATSPLSPVGVRLRVEAAHQAGRREPGEQSLHRASLAVAAAQAAGVEQWRARAVLGQALMFCNRVGWADELRRVVAEAQAAGDDEAERAAAFSLVSGLGFVGELPEAVRVGHASLARLRDFPFGTWHAHFNGALVMHEMLMGSDRDGVIERARQLLAARPLFRNRAQVECALTVALADSGRFGEAEQALREARRMARNDEDRSLLLVAEAELGWLQDDSARVETALLAVRGQAGDWFGVTAIVRTLAAYCTLDGATLMDDGAPRPGLPALAPLVIEHQALRAAADGDCEGAVALLDDAARRWDAVHLARFALRARWAAAELAARNGRSDTRLRLDSVRSRASDLPGMGGRIRAVAARLERGSAAALSAREHDVLALVGEGLTSSAIASRLGIATATVESHIRSARLKVGARTRRQAVATLDPRPL